MKNKLDDEPLKLLAGVLIPLAIAFLLVRALGPAFAALSGPRRGAYFPPDLSVLGDKFEYFAPRADRYTAIFIGSSASYHGIVPRVFDEEASRLGPAQTSFNFGAGKMSFAEADRLLESVLRLRPKNLRWILIDVNLATHWNSSWDTDRYVDWNSPEQVALLTRCTLADGVSLASLADLAPHWLGAFEHLWGSGETGYFFRSRLSLRPADGPAPHDDEGFQGLGPAQGDRHWEFMEALRQYRDEVAEMRRAPAAAGLEGSRYRAAMFRRMAEEARLHGATAVFYSPPVVLPRSFSRPLAGSAYLPFDSPAAHPDLYAPSARWDYDHLTVRGSKTFSRMLARAFARPGA